MVKVLTLALLIQVNTLFQYNIGSGVRRIIQWVLISAIGIFMLLIISVAGTFLYVYFNRDLIIKRVSESVNQSINGELVTGKISVDFLHYFPGTAIHISDVSIRDSLFYSHKMEFLRAADMYVKINFMELFSPEPALKNITIENGSVYIFKDHSGYTNQYLFQTKAVKNSSGFKTWLQEINLKDFRFVFSDQIVGSYHNIFFNKLRCGIHKSQDKTALAIKSDGIIKMLAFKLSKGAYAKSASFNNNFILYYHKEAAILEVPEHTFYLNDQLVVAKAMLELGDRSYFNADIRAPRILFENAVKMAMSRTERMLLKYKFKQPLSVRIHLEGSLKPGSQPLVNAELITDANTVTYKEYTFTQCRLNVLYTNRTDSIKEITASNNSVVIKNFSGKWHGIPVRSEKIRFFNFPFPSVDATLVGTFPLRDLNKVPGGGLYNFSNGTGNYKAEITASSDSIAWDTDIRFSVNIKDGALVYEPRGMAFEEVNASIIINNNDVYIQSASCRSGSSFLSLKGQAPGILNTDEKDLRNSLLNWEIQSSYINLEDFTTFLGRRKKGSLTGKKNSYDEKSDFGKHLERYLDACRLRMKLDIDALRFEKFTATGLSGIVQLTVDNWSLEAIRFNHADGAVKLSGKLSPSGDNMQSVTIQTKLEHVNIAEVFTAFDNFSQQTITANQINGTLDADVQLGFTIDNKASISQSSISGLVELTIRDGELKGFQPMGKLSKFLFRKRDFSDIRFSEITNSFAAKGNEIYFDRMKINTSIMELYVEGSFQLDGKTDMRFQIPLSNLKSRDWSELSENITDKGDKGMNVFIHAETDEKGELRFKYDPLKKLKTKNPRP